MEESEDKSAEEIKFAGVHTKTKPKKRSRIERELETSLTARVTSPLTSGGSTTTSRYGRARRMKSDADYTHLNTSSVVKTLDFDGKKKKKKEKKTVLSKNDLFDLEAQSEYQVGDLAWARMGTYPFWPCIITRDPLSGMFVKKKLFGRIERDVLHVTFFGDNGRRAWIVGTMLRKFLGQLEFEAAKTNFTPEAKKKDPRLYAAFFISDRKMPQWVVSVDEAEFLLKEPKRLRIDILNDMLQKGREIKTTPKHDKSNRIVRTNSDVSLSDESGVFLKFKKTLPSTDSSPAGPILKRKLIVTTDETTTSAASKRKRVSFHNPPVSTTIWVKKYIERESNEEITSTVEAALSETTALESTTSVEVQTDSTAVQGIEMQTEVVAVTLACLQTDSVQTSHNSVQTEESGSQSPAIATIASKST